MKKQKLILRVISFYQGISRRRNAIIKNIFPALSGVEIGVCRYSPTCSTYAYEAIERYGIVKGVYLGIMRVFRCHPWSKGGLDPVPEK